jgi:ParB-like chromosome segregation protein Spo0J
MSEIEIKISALNDNPWRFKVISSKDFSNLVNAIATYGSHTTNPILIARISEKFYIVDGHSRRDAIAEAGFDKARCIVADWIRNFNDLRIWSFRLNRHGNYNPLELLSMVKEDVKVHGSVEKVAAHYGVSVEYVKSILKLDALDDASKAIVDKVIDVARKRYQFVLEQINAYHLANIAELEPKKQLEVLEWLFHDIMYGPPNESLVSLPSIYELVNEIERHKSAHISGTLHRKYKTKEPVYDKLEFSCSCGNRFHIDFSTEKVYEYMEQDNLIIKKEVETSREPSQPVSKAGKRSNVSKNTLC